MPVLPNLESFLFCWSLGDQIACVRQAGDGF